MLKRILLLITVILLFLEGCSRKVNVILETDIGNDIDDALALVLLNKYIDEGKANCLMVGINKTGTLPAEYVDVVNTFYGHGDIPVGIAINGIQPADSSSYNKVARLKNSDGEYLFAHSVSNYDSLPNAVKLYRKVLSESADHSVTITSVGFSTNLTQLLETQGDEFSPLCGEELIAKKVSLLSVMAGSCDGSGRKEYNIIIDIPSAQKLFAKWPTKIVISPWELGGSVLYPASSIEKDFNWCEHHPYPMAYRMYGTFPKDRQSWDPTSLIYAVEGCGKWFTESSPLDVSITDDGRMIMSLNPGGKVSFICSSDEQKRMLEYYLVHMATQKPQKE